MDMRELESDDVPDTTRVRITARAIAATRSDNAVERAIGQLASDAVVHSTTWAVERAVPEN
jgi:putative Mg2+ transporter-C (MgtC) family protein